jgi:hypothetical protein
MSLSGPFLMKECFFNPPIIQRVCFFQPIHNASSILVSPFYAASRWKHAGSCGCLNYVDKSLVASEAAKCFGFGGEHCGLRKIEIVFVGVAHVRKSKTGAKSPMIMMKLCLQ